MHYGFGWWAVFGVSVTVMLILDLGVFNRKAHEISMKEALVWSVVWTVVALIFNLGIYLFHDTETALNFFTGYLIERSLSMDNLFVFLLVFSYFGVSAKYQHRILFWGILGALFFRALFIAAGVTLIHRFEWIIYVFGAVLIWSGMGLWAEKEKEIHPEKNVILTLFKKFFPVTPDDQGGKFLVRIGQRLHATQLLVVLIVVESTDVVFAVDSIPAILAITTDPFIVYSSNIFAILGLRALYFALAALMRLFHHLHYGLCLILVFVGLKMMVSHFFKIPIAVTLLFITMVLTLSVVASLVWPKKTVA